MIHRILILVLILASCKNHRQTTISPTSGDSILSFLKKVVNPLYQNNGTEKAGKILDSLQPIVSDLNNYKVTCAWLRFRSVQKEMENQTDSALLFAEQALQLANEKDTTQKDLLGAQIQLANLLNKQKKFMEALKYGNNAYYLAHKIDTMALPLICLHLSEIYSALNDLAMNRKFLFEGFSRSVNPFHKTVFANNISRYYGEMEAYDSAIIFFKAVEKDTNIKSPYFDAVKNENLGIHLTNLKRYKEGLPYQLKAAAINKKLGRMDGLSYFNLAATYRHLKQFDESLRNLDSAMILAKKDGDLSLLRRIWHSRSSNFALQNNYAAAYAATDSAYSYYSTEMDSSLADQARELDTKYAVRAKDDEIKSLGMVNQANMKIRDQQKIIITSMIMATVLLGIIGLLMWRRRQNQMQQREAGLKQQLLRAQMDPHFLFNALSVLKSLIRNEGPEKSANYLSNLATLVRFNLENARENLVLFQNEIKALESYLNLQAMYHPGLFEYRMEIYNDFEQDEILIPPMLLQPFVENAISHGFMGIDYKGLVVIKIDKKHSTLDCIIEDNGKGLQPAEEKKPSLSTIINEERLSILSRQLRKPAKLTITEKQKENLGSGVKVEIIIPFRGTAAWL